MRTMLPRLCMHLRFEFGSERRIRRNSSLCMHLCGKLGSERRI